MIGDKDTQFLKYVESYVAENPDVSPHVGSFVSRGLEVALNQLRDDRSAMEVALSVALAHRYKDRDSLIKAKLKSLGNRTSLRWDWFIKEKQND